MSALILAKTIANSQDILEVKGEMGSYVQRLYRYKLFAIGEIADFAGVSEYKIHQYLVDEEEYRARSGIRTSHLDHLIRMVGSPDFARLHIKSLLDDGATIAAASRVTGLPETSLRRWAEGKD